MAPDESNPGDFISLSSSEDEIPPPPKKSKRSHEQSEDTLGLSARNASAERPKRARMSSSSASSASNNRVSEEGEIDENSASDDEGQISNSGDPGEGPEGLGQGGVFVPSNPPVFIKDAMSLQLPVFTQKREGSWFARFKEWMRVFCTINSQHAGNLSAQLVLTAYRQYIDLHSGLKSSKKRGAKQAAGQKEATKFLANLLLSIHKPKRQNLDDPAQSNMAPNGQLSTSDKPSDLPNGQLNGQKTESSEVFIIDLSKQPVPLSTKPPYSEAAPNNGGDMTQIKGIPSGPSALEQQRRYFPSAGDPTSMCLLCGCEGHLASNCSNYSCKFCRQSGHWDYVCPTIKPRCRKCNQLGHTASSCVEKLVLTKGEGLACSFCHSSDHLEVECTEIWRSFRLDDHIIKTVVALPVSCATCGSGQHYAADCSQRQSYAANPTWSLTNRNRYLDPECGLAAIEVGFAGPDQKSAGRPSDMKIRGHASRTTHVHYSESDDSEVEFLGQRASGNRPARIGQIRVSSNLQMPNGGQPSLPPGPPPVLPPQPLAQYPPPPGVSGYGFSQQSVAPPSLPAKPPTSTRDYSNVPPPPATQDHRNSSGRGGRGGRGGGRGGRGGRGGGGGGGRGSRGDYRGGKFRGKKFK